MKSASALITASALSLIMLGNAKADDRARNLNPLFGDVHAAAGQEVIVPAIKFNDVSPADGYPESVNVSFKVFTAGTNTLVRQTQPKTIPTPVPLGCAVTPSANDLDMDFDVTRRGALLNGTGAFLGASKRLAMAFNMRVVCETSPGNWVETLSGFVYSADLSGTEDGPTTPGPAWFKSFPGKAIEGLNGIDVDNDLVNDFQMITTGWRTATGWSVGAIYAAGKTGAINTTITTSGGSSYTLPTSSKAYVVLQ